MLMKMVECNLVVFSSTDLQRFIALRSSASVRFTLQLVSIFHNTAIKSGMVRFSNSSESQRGFGTMDELERSCFFRVSLEQSMETCADPWTCVARWLTSPFLFLSTAWEVSFSLYFPLIFMWVKHCMMGTANVLHSLIAGHCLRLFVENFSEWTPAWLHSMVLHPSANGKTDHRAWPPPALVMLASLTLFALVVHPDGFTWILLGKIR